MNRRYLRINVLRDDTASALVSVLVIIVVVTLIAGAVFAYASLQHRFFARDVQLLEARYAAEAAVYEALSQLGGQNGPEPQELALAFENDTSAEATIAVHGAFRKITAFGRKGRHTVTIHAVSGVLPGEAFADAIHTTDPHAGLILAGSTTVIGDVRTGAPGVRTDRFRAQPFTGALEGEALPPGPEFAFSGHLQALFNTWRSILDGADQGHVAEALILEGDHEVPCEPGQVSAHETEGEAFPHAHHIVITGNATLPPGCRLRPAASVISGGTVTVSGALDAPHLLVYGREGIAFASGAEASGQFFSDGLITVSEEAYLRYPTLLYSSGAVIDRNSDWQSELRQSELQGPDSPFITLHSGAAVDGIVMVPPAVAEVHRTAAEIVVEDEATVRGALINARSTTLHGTVLGSVFTDHFRFYESPTFYVNWLKDATVDVTARPEPFALPFALAGKQKAVIVDWWEE